MEGEDEDSENPRAFNNAKIWKRMIVIVAGAFMNIVLGLVFMFITLIPQEQFASTQVSQFSLGSFSAVTGLQPGDKIVEINGYTVGTSMDFSFALFTQVPVTTVDGSELSVYKEDCSFDLYTYAQGLVDKDTTEKALADLNRLCVEVHSKIASADSKEKAYSVFCECIDELNIAVGKEKPEKYPEIEERESRQRYRAKVKVIRNGERIELNDVDFMTVRTADDDKPKLQMDFYVEPIEKNFGTVVSQAFGQTVSTVRTVWGGLIGLIKGQFSFNEMTGPVGLAAVITDQAGKALDSNGFGSAVNTIVTIMMIITINLGVVNMLPFPALDGGRFLMLLIEAIFRKPVPRKVESIINTVGLVLLLTLMAVIAVKDVWQLFNGGFKYG